jgi:hypothetical protein
MPLQSPCLQRKYPVESFGQAVVTATTHGISLLGSPQEETRGTLLTTVRPEVNDIQYPIHDSSSV